MTKPGEWPSPLRAAALAEAGISYQWVQIVGDDLWWGELRPSEGGRVAVVSRKHGDLLPQPWSAKHRVHEYGGLSWLGIMRDGKPHLLFTHKNDQRLYLMEIGSEPRPITAASSDEESHRYADLLLVGDEIWCIREKTRGVHAERDLVAITFDGNVRTLESSSHFYSRPRISPDGSKLAWTCWEHPLMPWDGTELRIADVVDGNLTNIRTVMGGTEESVQYHDWRDNERIVAISDASGWWNPWEVTTSGQKRQILKESIEWGGPEWQLGFRTLAVLDENRAIALKGTAERLAFVVLDLDSGEYRELTSSHTHFAATFSASGDVVYSIAAGPKSLRTIVGLSISKGGEFETVTGVKPPIDPKYFTTPRAISVPGKDGRTVHAIFHPAYNPYVSSNEKPPLVVTAHGGPTSHVAAVANLKFAYYTTRGISVVDVNYGGSTMYGREYRNLLRGQWGVVDHEDVISVVEALVAAGEVDADKVAITGGSAGGYTVLNALMRSDVFAVGADHFGVADLTPFVTDTHDFESRYLDSLIGPYPERQDLYLERSPSTYAENLTTPLIIFQGSEDPIVPPNQSQLFRDICIQKGLKYKYFEFDGESHGFVKAETIITAAEEELMFFGDVMGFKPVLS